MSKIINCKKTIKAKAFKLTYDTKISELNEFLDNRLLGITLIDDGGYEIDIKDLEYSIKVPENHYMIFYKGFNLENEFLEEDVFYVLSEKKFNEGFILDSKNIDQRTCLLILSFHDS